MRALMGLIKDQHGTFCARKKVPAHLQAAVARVLGKDKNQQAWLKRSLSTKDLREAKIRVKPVQHGLSGELSRERDPFELRTTLAQSHC